ncbi:hypothetical protein V8E55_005266 [Tylopilus felleus]
MSVPPGFLKGLFVRKSVNFSGYTLLLYDYLITFPLEVQYIWGSPWTPVKAGFLVNRYGNLIGQALVMLEETGYVSHGSEEFCKYFRLYCSLYMVFSADFIRILVVMRAWAIWGCRYGVAVFAITLYVLYVLAVSARVIYSQIESKGILFDHLRQVGVCASQIPRYIWLMWAATLVLDTVVLVMVWHSLRRLFKEASGNCRSPLVHLLVRDAILFYAASVFNNVFSIICWTVFRKDPTCFLQIGISFPLLRSVVGQRLVLNLRGFQARHLTTSDLSQEVDRQMAMMGDLLWPDLVVKQANLEQSEKTKTSRATGSSVDPTLELAALPRS